MEIKHSYILEKKKSKKAWDDAVEASAKEAEKGGAVDVAVKIRKLKKNKDK